MLTNQCKDSAWLELRFCLVELEYRLWGEGLSEVERGFVDKNEARVAPGSVQLCSEVVRVSLSVHLFSTNIYFLKEGMFWEKIE